MEKTDIRYVLSGRNFPLLLTLPPTLCLSLIPSPTTTHLVVCRFGGVDGEVAPEHPAAEGVCGVVRFPHLPSHGHLLQETVGSLGLLFLLSRRPRPEDLRREEFTRVVQRNAKLMLRILRMELLSNKGMQKRKQRGKNEMHMDTKEYIGIRKDTNSILSGVSASGRLQKNANCCKKNKKEGQG